MSNVQTIRHVIMLNLSQPYGAAGAVGAYQQLYVLAQQSCIRSKEYTALSPAFIKYVSVGF